MKTEHSKNWKLGTVFIDTVKPEDDTIHHTGWDYQTANIVTDDGIIGEVKGMNIEHFAPVSTFEANAALMLTAPELLESLRGLWMLSTNIFGELSIEEIEDDEHLKLLSDAIDKAKQTIVKATTFEAHVKSDLV